MSTSGEHQAAPPGGLPGLAAFEAAIEGSVVLPGSPDYEHLRKPAWAQSEDVRPAAVALCATPADVAETITFGRRSGAETVARSGGHCFAGRSSTRGILIDLSPMRSVSVADGLATVGAGALLGDVYEELDVLGLTIAAGACPSVGIGGLTLGGGLGILGRKYGLTSDQLVDAQVVLGGRSRHRLRRGARRRSLLGPARRRRGQLRSRHELHLQDGSGGRPHLLQAGLAVRAAQQRRSRSGKTGRPARRTRLRRACSSMHPAISKSRSSRSSASMLGSETETAGTLDEAIVRLGVDPASSDACSMMSHRAAKSFLVENAPGAEHQGERAGEPPQPLMLQQVGVLPAPATSGDDRVHWSTPSRRNGVSGQARELDFTPWGGAYNRTRPEATAFVHRGERFLLKHAVVLDADASMLDRDAARDWLARSWSLVHPHGDRAASFPTSPTRTFPRRRAPTTAPTTTASRASRRDTTPTTSSVSTSLFRPQTAYEMSECSAL